jgi:hypothetical protein
MLGDLLGDFVTFEHMLESQHLPAEFVGDVHQHQDFIGAVAV